MKIRKSISKKVLIVSSSMSKANMIPFSNFIRIVENASYKMQVIATYEQNASLDCDDHFNIDRILYTYNAGPLGLISLHLKNQMLMILRMLRNLKDIDICIFYLGDVLIFPILLSKVLRKKVILVLGGFLEKEVELNGYPKSIVLLKKINMAMANFIVIYSPRLIKDWHLEKYEKKVLYSHKHFLNFKQFRLLKDLNERPNLVGYIGRFSNEKGVLNLIHSIPSLLQKDQSLKFMFIGDGILKDQITKFVNDMDLRDSVKVNGWVSHETLPDYLNNFKFIIIPSYTEGLPNILLESMACGAITIATAVGSIPDFVKDGQTGFIMENNSLDCIVSTFIRASSNTSLDTIAKSARSLVEREFTQEEVTKKYNNIISNLCCE